MISKKLSADVPDIGENSRCSVRTQLQKRLHNKIPASSTTETSAHFS